MTVNIRDRIREVWSTAPPMYPDNGRQFRSFSEATTPEYELWYKETWGPTKIKPAIEHAGIDENAPLLRFMGLAKFLDLIVNRQLLMPPIDKLKACDPYECTSKPDYSGIPRKELEEQLIALQEFVPKSERDTNAIPLGLLFPLQSPPKTYEKRVRSMSDQELIEALWFAEHARLKQDVVCSCWYGSKIESDAMWRQYRGHVGVSITTSVSRLKRAVTCYVPKALVDGFKLYLAKVTYANSVTCEATQPWLVKRLAYRHEEELRLYLDYPFVRAGGFQLIVDPRVLIENITVTPFAQKWEFEAIKAAVKRILSGSDRMRWGFIGINPAVEQSTHMGAADLNGCRRSEVAPINVH